MLNNFIISTVALGNSTQFNFSHFCALSFTIVEGMMGMWEVVMWYVQMLKSKAKMS